MRFANANSKHLVSVGPMLGTALTDLRASPYCAVAADSRSWFWHLVPVLRCDSPATGRLDGEETIKQLPVGV